MIQGEHARRPRGVATQLRPPQAKVTELLSTISALAAQALPELSSLHVELRSDAGLAGAAAQAEQTEDHNMAAYEGGQPNLDVFALLRCALPFFRFAVQLGGVCSHQDRRVSCTVVHRCFNAESVFIAHCFSTCHVRA